MNRPGIDAEYVDNQLFVLESEFYFLVRYFFLVFLLFLQVAGGGYVRWEVPPLWSVTN